LVRHVEISARGERAKDGHTAPSGQGKKDEARQMLSDIYGWFTEGFDTKDLQEAKAPLEELG